MDKRTGGLLLGAAAGLTLVWYFLRQNQPEVDLYIVLEPLDGGGSRVATKPRDVELRYKQKVNWRVTNNCAQDIDVSMEGWRDRNGNRVSPAAESNDPNQTGLKKNIKAHDSGMIKGKARFGFFETCYYDVYLDDKLGADPIVKLTP